MKAMGKSQHAQTPAYLVGNCSVIAGPEAPTKQLNAHNGKYEEEQADDNGYIRHGGQ